MGSEEQEQKGFDDEVRVLKLVMSEHSIELMRTPTRTRTRTWMSEWPRVSFHGHRLSSREAFPVRDSWRTTKLGTDSRS